MGILHYNYPLKGCDPLAFQIFWTSWKQLFFVVLKNSKFANLSPIRGSLVLGKPMEYWNVKACSVHFWAGVNILAVPRSQVVKYFYCFFNTNFTIRFTPGFHWTYRVDCRKYIKKHNFAIELWTWFLRKFLSTVRSKRVRILIFCEVLRYVLEVLLHPFFKSVLSISNIKVTAAFARYLVNDTTSTTFTSVCTPTF